ncbi:AMP-binding protein [Neisseria chenwenguii]|uniref:AMP-binding protein n=1 Tax=Neisseria chenwenguii TaxID=1853278 RepID=A0A220S0B4_9NEIS|nr:AMP-binding protein [Neisseria chenwenguii]ASK26921.1 AMP-binding protein [Neisseria chenwenguii]
MQKLTQIFSPTLNSDDLIAVSPDWTRADFNRTVFALSGRLKAAGVRSAALWFEDAALFACAVLAAWHAGAEVWLLPNLAAENTEWGGGADVWLTDVPSEIAAKNVSDGLNIWSAADVARMPSENIGNSLNHEDFRIPAAARALLKTSGSSGASQIVVKTAAQMEAEAWMLAQTLPFQEDVATVAGSVSPQHMYGFTFRFALVLTMGWPMVRAQCVYPETLLAAAAAQEKSVWIASPALLNRLGANRNWNALEGRVAGIVSAGGALPDDTADLLAQYAVRPFEIYGSTETGVAAWRSGSALWQPLPEVVLAQNDAGALSVASPWSGGRFQTADLVEMQNGGFTLLGRQDRIIKFEDKRVSLTEIEHKLLAHDWIADAHCGVHPQHGRIAVWAALNAEGIEALRGQGRAAVAAVLKRHLAGSLDKVVLPRYWRFADALPRNTQSKIAAADFQTAFTEAQTSPVWMPSENPAAQENGFEFVGKVPLDLAYFGGHFAGFPLVPGVVELQWVRDLAAQFEWGRQSVVRVENLKYQQFVRPNDTVAVRLDYDAGKNRLTFKMTNSDAVCAGGRLVFGTFGGNG